ncbi:unnamed protein product [Rotaria sp. Silwood1]|nr:unnamed protein product [Rotaria sp. Silwood1]CAF3725837.1 unnamed protein product [Rotaria sp. Silwood1]
MGHGSCSDAMFSTICYGKLKRFSFLFNTLLSSKKSNGKPMWPIIQQSLVRLQQLSAARSVTYRDLEGGGVLGSGCVQEEIRFSICPEMLVSLLVCEMMKPDECIFLIGCERYSSYKGYANNFEFDNDYRDDTPKDNWGRKWCHLVAMDAIYFRNPSIQYDMKYINRELIKAYTCFRLRKVATIHQTLFGIATGNWGCGAFNGDKQLKDED